MILQQVELFQGLSTDELEALAASSSSRSFPKNTVVIHENDPADSLFIIENGKVKVLRDGYTGSVDEVDGGLLEALLERGLLPVLTPPGVSLEGDAINVDGDRAASATARALNADTLLMLSNVPGYLADFPDEDSLVTSLDREGLGAAREGAEGRMRVKLLAAEEALDGGVARVVIGDARGANPVQAALDGAGTHVRVLQEAGA